MVLSIKGQISGLSGALQKRVNGFVQAKLSEALSLDVLNSRQLKSLSFWLQRALPFNQPHRLSIISLENHQAKVALPFIRPNTNHVGGLHACALVTAGELSAGVLLLKAFPPTQYRLLLADLSITYKRQGFSDAVATCAISEKELQEIRAMVSAKNRSMVKLTSEVTDAKGKTLCTLLVTWHLKRVTDVVGD
jgi:acyl-coenzyme A thioesterase PaaI-like protein